MKLVSSVGVSFDVTGDCNHRPVLQQIHMNAVTGNTMQKASRAYRQRRSFKKKQFLYLGDPISVHSGTLDVVPSTQNITRISQGLPATMLSRVEGDVAHLGAVNEVQR